MTRWFSSVLLFFLAQPLSSLAAQAWNDGAVSALVQRAIERRTADQASGLEDYRARAHGFVFFLAQLGEDGLAEPPQLVKSDQLELEVYWRPPGASKQVIVGWRDRVDLPTDIQYHRDHLGIVQNGFADRIRLGEGDEVRDVPHPLAPDGPSRYDYAIVDSVTLALPGRPVRAVEVAFRPRSYDEPRIVGSMYLDASGGELVQLRFNFTRSAYLDASLEDITVLLENALWNGRWWLPRRQEIEIRRRTSWLDLPARGIIRGRWVIDSYDFNVGLAQEIFRGPEITAAPRAVRDSFPWGESLDLALAEAAGPVTTVEMDEVRARVRRVAGGQFLSGLPQAGVAVASVSDLVLFNRVEGFRVGAGVMIRPGAGPLTARAWAGYGFSDERFKARVRFDVRTGNATYRVHAARQVRDIADDPPIAPLLHSLVAQERATDYGHYVLVEEAFVGAEATGFTVEAGVQRSLSVSTRATPASGVFDPNPVLGAGVLGVGRLRLARGRRRLGHQTGYRVAVDVEGGVGGDNAYARARVRGWVGVAAPGGSVEVSGWVGWGSNALPRHRPFLLGGRGSLVGEPHRGYGGRQAGLVRVDWKLSVPFPALPLGPFASTGRRLVLAPFVAAGGVGRAYAGMPWGQADGLRPVAGIAVELFHQLLRAELGWGIRSGDVGITLDVRRALWSIL